MIQSVFREGHLTEECTWNTVVLIPKGFGDLCGIGLVEVLWKMVTAIQFRNTLHGFCTVRGTGTAYLKSKLIQNLMEMREEVLYDIFLDLHKSYDTLDPGLCL